MTSHRDQTPVLDLEAPAPAPPGGMDRWPSRRRRNLAFVAIIAVGALNLLAYTAMYAALGGDAHNGYRREVVEPDGERVMAYYVRGHFIRTVQGQEARVHPVLWHYSYVHSISVWLTNGAMIISMLMLARPHIIATMRDGWVSGRTFVAVFGTIVVLISAGGAFVFTWDFITQITGG